MAKSKDFFFIKNYSSHGDMAINRHAFEDIALNVIKKIKGVKPFNGQGASKSFKMYRPIVCNITKDNKVDLNIDISIKKSIDIKSTCIKIQEEVNNALILSCETVPIKVNINVANIEI